MQKAETLNRIQRIFVLLMVVTALATAAGMYFEGGLMSDAKHEADAMAKEVGGPAEIRAEMTSLRTQIVDNRMKLQHLEMNVSTRDYVPTMLGEMERFCTESGLKIVGVRPIAKKAKPKPTDAKAGAPKEGDEDKKKEEADKLKEQKKPYEELDIEIQASGRFPEIVDFLKRLGSFPKVIAVRSVAVTTKNRLPGETGPPSLDVTFSVRAYIFKQKPAEVASTTSFGSGEAKGGG